MKSAIRAVIKRNQKKINKAGGKTKDAALSPSAVYRKAYGIFADISGALSVSSLGHSEAKIAHMLATLLQASRIAIAKLQKRINGEPGGAVKLKKFIPAVFGRLVAKDFGRRTGIKLKQTTLGKGSYKARNRYNRPNAWESKALKKVASSGWKRNKGFGQAVSAGYRHLKPIYIKRACLTCHGTPKGSKGPYGHFKEGYRVNELRGGISVLIPKGK